MSRREDEVTQPIVVVVDDNAGVLAAAVKVLKQLPLHVLATTDYNGRFASAARAGHIFGVQFHPEKSHDWGVQLLKNFAEM